MNQPLARHLLRCTAVINGMEWFQAPVVDQVGNGQGIVALVCVETANIFKFVHPRL